MMQMATNIMYKGIYDYLVSFLYAKLINVKLSMSRPHRGGQRESEYTWDYRRCGSYNLR